MMHSEQLQKAFTAETNGISQIKVCVTKQQKLLMCISTHNTLALFHYCFNSTALINVLSLFPSGNPYCYLKECNLFCLGVGLLYEL